jgi:hypothetical protein
MTDNVENLVLELLRATGDGRISLTVWIQTATKERLLALVASEQSTNDTVADRLLNAAMDEAEKAENSAIAKNCPLGQSDCRLYNCGAATRYRACGVRC